MTPCFVAAFVSASAILATSCDATTPPAGGATQTGPAATPPAKPDQKDEKPKNPPGQTEKVTIGDKEFTLTLAIDHATREKGLGGVTELPEFGGMLFVFPDSAVRSFWMKDCVIDIDIAFLDPFGFVTAVHTMPKEFPRDQGEPEASYGARLRKYSSLSPAQFAIEVRPGMLKSLGIKRGSKIPLDLAKLKAAAK